MSNRFLSKFASVCFVIAIFGSTLPAKSAEGDAQVAIEARVLALNERVEGIMGEARVALVSASDHLARGMDEGEAIAHAYMKRQVLLTRGLRAILGINADGYIIADSYNSPPPGVNLAKREYFIAAQETHADFAVYHTVIGKTSGVPFVPLGLPRKSVSGRFNGVVVGILQPDSLLGRMFPCRDCVMSVVLLDDDPKPLISRPAQSIVPKLLIQTIQESSDESGVWIGKFGTFPAVVGWRKSNRFGLVSIYAEPNSDLVRMSND